MKHKGHWRSLSIRKQMNGTRDYRGCVGGILSPRSHDQATTSDILPTIVDNIWA